MVQQVRRFGSGIRQQQEEVIVQPTLSPEQQQEQTQQQQRISFLKDKIVELETLRDRIRAEAPGGSAGSSQRASSNVLNEQAAQAKRLLSQSQQFVLPKIQAIESILRDVATGARSQQVLERSQIRQVEEIRTTLTRDVGATEAARISRLIQSRQGRSVVQEFVDENPQLSRASLTALGVKTKEETMTTREIAPEQLEAPRTSTTSSQFKPITFSQALFGKESEQFVGANIKPRLGLFESALFAKVTGKSVPGAIIKSQQPDVTFAQLKTGVREFGIGGKVLGEFIPTTPGQLAVVGVASATLPFAAPVVRIGASSLFTGLGAKTAFDTDLPTETRIAGGIGATLAGTATFIEAAPFIKGTLARTGVFGEFKSVKTQAQGFKAISKVEGKNVGLIPKGSGDRGVTLKGSPLKKGAFGLKSSDYNKFVGAKQTATTSQIGFFKKGQSVKLQKEFFVTPQEPTLGIPITRTSRLGLVELFKTPKGINFGLGAGKPQIGLFKGATIGTKVAKGVFRIGRQTGLRTGELEATAGIGQIVTTTGKIGVTAIKGQLVTLFGARLSGTPTGGVSAVGTTATGSTIPITSAVSPAVSTTLFTSTRTTPTRTQLSTNISTPTTSPTTTFTISSEVSPPLRISFPTTTPTSGSSAPLSRLTFTPTTTSLPGSSPLTPPVITPGTKKFSLFDFGKKIKQPKSSTFSTQVKRGGKFRTIGSGLGIRQAFSLGQQRVDQTLGATFRIRGGPTPKFTGFDLGKTLRRKRGKARTFVEKKEFRLSDIGEIGEIKRAKRRKRK